MRVLKNAFIILEIIIYVSFLSLDATNNAPLTSAWIKYAGIILCFSYVLLNIVYEYLKKYRKGSPTQSMVMKGQKMFWSCDSLLLMMGLFFTVLSDYNLLLTEHYTAGVFFFCFVQTFYMIRIALNYVVCKKGTPLNLSLLTSKSNDNRSNIGQEAHSYNGQNNSIQPDFKRSFISVIFKRTLIHVLIIIIVVAVLTMYKVEVDLLLVLTCFYFMSLALNVVFAFRNRTFSSFSRLFAYGLILFICCDINVGIFNLADFININGEVYRTLYRVSTLGMWFFYLPSQVLIALSFHKTSLEK